MVRGPDLDLPRRAGYPRPENRGGHAATHTLPSEVKQGMDNSSSALKNAAAFSDGRIGDVSSGSSHRARRLLSRFWDWARRRWPMAECLILVPFVAAGCATARGGSVPVEEPVRLNVFAAASLVRVFGELGPAFEEAHPGVQVLFNFAGSQQLAQQIVLGAPADVFASANQEQMEVVIAQGQAVRQDVHPFATNRLVIVFPIQDPGRPRDLKDIARPGLKLVMAAPEAPAGAYALSFIERAGESPEFGPEFRKSVLANVVSHEENVRAVLSKVELGEADAGIVYASDAAGGSGVGTLSIPPELNPDVTYPITVLRESPKARAARAFVDFVRSPSAAAILRRFGFTPVEG